MHDSAYQFVKECCRRIRTPIGRCIEVGSLNVNGSARDHIVAGEYIGIDMIAGCGVDIVGDFMLLDLPDADVIVSTEALEHYHDQAGFVRRLAGIAKRGCALILTCAAPDRGAHSCDGGQLHDGEFYRNPDPQHVLMWLMTCGWRIVIFDHDKSAGDLRVMAFYEPAD